MPDDDAGDNKQDTEPIEVRSVDDASASDPGPIQLDLVLKNIGRVSDHMAHRDLHISDIGGDSGDKLEETE